MRAASSRCERRVVAVDAAAEHGDRRAAGLERAAVRLAVDPAREAAHDDEPRAGELAPEHARDLRAVRRACARTDDRDRRPGELGRRPPRRGGTAPAADRGSRAGAVGSAGSERASQRSPRRSSAARYARASNVRAKAREAGVVAALGDARALRARRRTRPGRARSRAVQLPRRAVRRGPRRRARPRRAPSRRAPRSSRATRATRARPRPESGSRSTARVEQRRRPAGCAEGSTCASRARASRTRSRTGADPSPAAAASSCARGRGTVTTRSKRSSSARESLFAYAVKPLRRARAGGGRIAARTARAEVHRREQLKARRDRAPSPRRARR